LRVEMHQDKHQHVYWTT